MFDIEDFYRRLGAERVPGQGEQLMLPDNVRVSADASGWTAIFESLGTDELKMRSLLEACNGAPGLIAFSTRSGIPAARWSAEMAQGDPGTGARALSTLIRGLSLS